MYVTGKGQQSSHSLEVFFYLFSDVYKALLKLVRWVLFCPLLISMSEAFAVTFTLNKIYTMLWVTEAVFGPRVKSPSETTSGSVHCLPLSYHLGCSSRIFKTSCAAGLYGWRHCWQMWDFWGHRLGIPGSGQIGSAMGFIWRELAVLELPLWIVSWKNWDIKKLFFSSYWWFKTI